MTKPIRHLIRDLLRNHPDGLTIAEIMKQMGGTYEGVSRSLRSMPDTYIDRWLPRSGAPAAVWCAVEVPEDCPKPKNTGMTFEQKREYHRAYSNAAYHKKVKERHEKKQFQSAGLTEIRGPWPTHH